MLDRKFDIRERQVLQADETEANTMNHTFNTPSRSSESAVNTASESVSTTDYTRQPVLTSSHLASPRRVLEIHLWLGSSVLGPGSCRPEP